jgi:hypothetical protein
MHPQSVLGFEIRLMGDGGIVAMSGPYTVFGTEGVAVGTRPLPPGLW